MGGGIFENQNVIDAFQGSDHTSPIGLANDRASGTLQGADALIAVDGDDQDVAESGRFLQHGHVANM